MFRASSWSLLRCLFYSCQIQSRDIFVPCKLKLRVRRGPNPHFAGSTDFCVFVDLLHVRESAERASRTVTRLLHVVALRRLVNVRMELLFCARVTHAAAVALFALEKETLEC